MPKYIQACTVCLERPAIKHDELLCAQCESSRHKLRVFHNLRPSHESYAATKAA